MSRKKKPAGVPLALVNKHINFDVSRSKEDQALYH
jgi:hypothetical protein